MSMLKYDDLDVRERKVLLLRVLGLSTDTILRLQDGDILLTDALSDRIREVMNNPDDTTQCAIVCRNICRDGASYETLEPDKYLEHINGLKAAGGRFADDTSTGAEQEPDTVREDGFAAFAAGIYPKPVLRYFARSLDLGIYTLILNLFCRLVLGFDPMSNSYTLVAWAYFLYLVMLAVEPVWIHLLGTTPGKWITGVRITDLNGNKLGWNAAFVRSFRLLRFGLGFMIPIYNIFKMVRSFADCRIGRILPWDLGTAIERPEENMGGRIALLIAALLVVGGADKIGNLYVELPKNRGAITEQEFYDNCAHIVKYDSITFSDVPEYAVETDENGYVKSVTFESEYTAEDKEEYIYKQYNEMYVAFLALAGAQKDFNPVAFEYGNASKVLLGSSFSSYEYDYAGMKIINEVTYTGYARNILSDYLYRLPDGTPYFKQTFKMIVNN